MNFMIYSMMLSMDQISSDGRIYVIYIMVTQCILRIYDPRIKVRGSLQRICHEPKARGISTANF